MLSLRHLTEISLCFSVYFLKGLYIRSCTHVCKLTMQSPLTCIMSPFPIVANDLALLSTKHSAHAIGLSMTDLHGQVTLWYTFQMTTVQQ